MHFAELIALAGLAATAIAAPAPGPEPGPDPELMKRAEEAQANNQNEQWGRPGWGYVGGWGQPGWGYGGGWGGGWRGW